MNNPTEVGLYLIKTNDADDFNYRKVAVWVGDHWRTPQVGRIDGDNRIPDGAITAWEGPVAIMNLEPSQPRKKMDPASLAKAIRDAIAQHPDLTDEVIAALIGNSVAYVKRILRENP